MVARLSHLPPPNLYTVCRYFASQINQILSLYQNTATQLHIHLATVHTDTLDFVLELLIVIPNWLLI